MKSFSYSTCRMKKCGIILYNQDTCRYLLVLGLKSQKWGFPKGHMERGETEQQTALRELKEETGIELRKPLVDRIRYRNNIYFMVSLYSSDLPLHLDIIDTNEIESAKWFSLEDIGNLPIEQCNFGLKHWIHEYMHRKTKNENIYSCVQYNGQTNHASY